LDEALCRGWIDGVRRSLDAVSYTIRFSPRRARSKWSAVNLRRVAALKAAGRMRPEGLAAFDGRVRTRAQYSYEERPRELPAAYARLFKTNPRAWAFFKAQPPGYRRTATWWIVSAAKEETRQRRLARLMADSARGTRMPEMAPGKRSAGGERAR